MILVAIISYTRINIMIYIYYMSYINVNIYMINIINIIQQIL